MRLTKNQKQEIVNLYWGDFYVENILDWFSEYHQKETKNVLKKELKSRGITQKEWKELCNGRAMFDWDCDEVCCDIELDCMNTLLELAHIDTEKNYVRE